MKNNIPTPAVIAIIAVLVLFGGFFFIRGATAGVEAPKPDPNRFLPEGVSPVKPS
ncbi:MAG: hypothetical protein ACO1SV_15850 [Fimbriimonas sp.]